MGELQVSVAEAAARVGSRGVPPERLHPVYRALLEHAEGAATSTPAATGDRAAEGTVLEHLLTARVLLVLALTDAAGTERLRMALGPDRVILDSSRDAGPSSVEVLPLPQLPARIGALLDRAGLPPAVPAQAVLRPEDGLRLTPAQIDRVRAELRRGTSPELAVATLEDLPTPLHDALTARGPRLAASLTPHDPGAAPERAGTWSRLWVRGERGLYRTDMTDALLAPVHPVAAGDVTGSLLAVLEEGVRHAATVGGASR